MNTVDNRYATLAKEASRLIRDNERSLHEILHELDTDEIMAACLHPVRLNEDQRTACLQELIFRLLKSPQHSSVDKLRSLAHNKELLSEADTARLQGLVEASVGSDSYWRCTRLIRELDRLATTQIHAENHQTALERVQDALRQGRPPGDGFLYVRVLLKNRSAGNVAGWVTDLTVDCARCDDTRLGRQFLDAARAGIDAARRWLNGSEPVRDLHPNPPIALAPARWPETSSSHSDDLAIDHGSCFLPFAVATVFHQCGLRLPSFVGITGAMSQGIVVGVKGLEAKLQSARAETIHTVYSVSDEACSDVKEIEHVRINGGPVPDVLSDITQQIGSRLFETAAPALMHHLPPPYVSGHMAHAFESRKPMPASVPFGSDGKNTDVDLNTAWGLDRTEWIGIVDGAPLPASDILSNFIAFETNVYDTAQSHEILPPIPARWWMPLPRKRPATLGSPDHILDAAEREWFRMYSPGGEAARRKVLTPMALLRRFGLTNSVAPGFVLELECSSTVSEVVEKLYSAFPRRSLALVICALPSADAGPNDLLETLRKRFPDRRVEWARRKESEPREREEDERIPLQADRSPRAWRRLFARLPSEALLNQLLGNYTADNEDLWRRAIFGFCAPLEWDRMNGSAHSDKRQAVQVARFDRSLPWDAFGN